MSTDLTQAKGSSAIHTSKTSISLIYGISPENIQYLSNKHEIASTTLVLYDSKTTTCWNVGTATGTPISWSINNEVLELITSSGTFSLQIATLGSKTGFDLIGQVSSYESLKLITPRKVGQKILLSSYYEGGTTGGGEFVAVLGTAVDDGGYTCVPTGSTSLFWQRIPINPGQVCATEFGLYDGATIDQILLNAINYCISKSIRRLEIPSLGASGYTINGGLEFVNSTNELTIYGPGMATKGVSPVITHTGNNIALTFKRNSQAQSLFNRVCLKNFTVVGSSSGQAFVRFSDFYGAEVKNSFIRDYTTGRAIDVYNNIGWTEAIIIDNVIVRTSQVGIWFHSNPASTDNQTLSFFGAKINNYAFQHGIAGASQGIKVGDGTRADNLYNCDIDMSGWWEGGGDSTAILALDKAKVDGRVVFRYDGFAASTITSSTQPCRLIRKSGTSGYVNLKCENYKNIAGLGLTLGTTELTIIPWLAIADITNGRGTAHPEYPGESIVSTPGMKCKLTGTLFKGQHSTVNVRGLLPYHRYKVTLRCNLSSTAQQQYIVNVPSPNNGGITTRTDSVPAATTTTNTVTTISGSTATSTSTSTTTNTNKSYGPFYITNAGGLVDNTYSIDKTLGFDIHLDGTHPNVVNDEYPVSIEIEAVD
ncbi:hypothetical protein RCIP0023_00446 [Klebsiella phage RCIP0023]